MESILIVDDEASIAEVLADLFEAEGYLVHKAADGQEALDHVARRPPNLILLDVMMPVLDGPGTLRRLRADPNCAEIPVVMMSAARRPADIDGCAAFVEKPFDMDRLVELVARILR